MTFCNLAFWAYCSPQLHCSPYTCIYVKSSSRFSDIRLKHLRWKAEHICLKKEPKKKTNQYRFLHVLTAVTQTCNWIWRITRLPSQYFLKLALRVRGNINIARLNSQQKVLSIMYFFQFMMRNCCNIQPPASRFSPFSLSTEFLEWHFYFMWQVQSQLMAYNEISVTENSIRPLNQLLSGLQTHLYVLKDMPSSFLIRSDEAILETSPSWQNLLGTTKSSNSYAGNKTSSIRDGNQSLHTTQF